LIRFITAPNLPADFDSLGVDSDNLVLRSLLSSWPDWDCELCALCVLLFSASRFDKLALPPDDFPSSLTDFPSESGLDF
jgi:hypothetical protein